jgi:hypothetical protein
MILSAFIDLAIAATRIPPLGFKTIRAVDCQLLNKSLRKLPIKNRQLLNMSASRVFPVDDSVKESSKVCLG